MPLYQTIDIQDISGPLFLTRFSRDDRPLRSSIQNFGLLNPPKLLKKDDQLQIIYGLARIESIQHMGQSKINCLIYEKADLDEAAAFIMCLELNHWDRDFNPVERALCLRTAQELFGSKNIPHTFFHCVGIKQNVRTVNQHKELLKLPDPVQKYAVNNNITLSVILGFLRFPRDDIEKVASQLFILPINQNRLAEILSLLLDISKREERKPALVLSEMLAEIEQEPNAVKKEQYLRQILNARRNPRYTNQLSAFEEKVKKLPLSQVTKVTPAPFFEDDFIEVNTRLSSPEDLEEFIQTLKHKNWKELLPK